MKKISIGILLSLISLSSLADENVVSIKTQSNITYEFMNPYRPGQGLKRVTEEDKHGDFTNIILTDDNNLYAYNTLSCDIPKSGISSQGVIVENIPQSGFYKITYHATQRSSPDGYCYGIYKIVSP